MNHKIKRAAVLGSGVMGAGIAAHLANVGIPTLMLDIVPRELTDAEMKKGLTLEEPAVRNRIAAENKKALLKQKPSPLTSKQNIELIEVGNFTDDMERLSEVDWVIEVVVENLDIKKKVLANVDRHRKEGSFVSSNTSGISIEAMAEECSDDFKKHFLGTHFFNPPRYLKLLEVIPTKHTSQEVLSFMKEFGENILGKGVVEAKDTPNFIANRIGTYGLLITVQQMLEKGYSVGEVDSVTGPMIGRPKSATFRTLDVVGLDTFIHVANNVYDQVKGEEKRAFEVPDFMKKMLEKGWLGSKSGQGFFLKKKGEKGSEILQLNPETLEYEKRGKLKTKATELAKQEKGTQRKLKALVHAEGDRAGDLVWSVIKPVLLYSAELYGEIADDVPSIDEAMRWGFGWELGPFEIWDSIGVQSSIERMKKEGETIPAWVEDMLEKGNSSFYKKGNGNVYFYHDGDYKQQQFNEKVIHLNRLKEEREVIKKNAGASLIDLGDGVAGLEFHSRSNAIGLDIIQMINYAVDHVDKNFEGLVIGNQAKNFCVGANLGMILMEAQDFNFFEIEMVVKGFQDSMMKLKYSDKPVVAAPFGMTLGGGAEVCLPADAIQASQETYMGLVETGVGLIPGGGGNKELYIKQIRNMPKDVEIDLQKVANSVFEKIAMAKVSTSGEEAKDNGFLDEKDAISVNGDHLLYDAKQKVLGLAGAGYQAPKRTKIPVVGEQGYATMVLGAKSLALSGYASEHDLKIAEKLAYVLAGGRLKQGTLVDEQYLLDLEREAFLSLVGEPKSQARMQHMLMKGKPLRN
ncbi:3-hydroxyacyl-CoA dehydrogenase [Halobacillus karajensis]|uniref:3-hydroxyacyl-CoA dehydrogenase n=1 Tax=Halobacillus karajensis TaxID=195088 RepID=A0A024P2L6_9BACI|nr:3-hydroxyacyl-CoA dehydrogenase/enoyl-CoA hydratase family protein [Halobacillus karajensis]CDQ19318.1 putative 3-hydroxyacyl-CoA dehydrogenase [Halobacillus karajensis]CDQ22519.1 putative 3-hydroxyacyl-CoA dehydrogenase [Halobacillus karajensis]CDQ26001.1 putative 3-hydroxyacyl-CoA dehydrogenase [Halobacillus karajensis]SEH38395.1 3-hydroxyacyl-CoA dehydrogenase [Halobacillus karajensis]